MNSAVRLIGVLAIGILFLGAVVGSIWLAQADVSITLPTSPDGGWALPTPTLFPTVAPREPVLSRPTPTESVATSEPEGETAEPEPTATSLVEMVCEIPEGWVYYTVESGDTFYSLAERSGTTLPALLDGNCKTAVYDLQAGEALYLPEITVSVPTSTPFVCSRPYGWQSVLIRPGDTFSSLARRYGVSLSVLLSMNCRDRSNAELYVGQTIYAPPRVVVPPTWPILPTPFPTFTAPPTPTQLPTVPPTPTPTPTPVPSATPTPSETPVLVPTWTPTPPEWELPTAGPPPETEQPPTETPIPLPTTDPAVTFTPTADAPGAGVSSPTPDPTTEAPVIPAPPPTATEAPPVIPTNTPSPEPPAAP